MKKQVKELEKLQAKLQKRSRPLKIEINLAFTKGIFHPKLYMFEAGEDAVVWIGSANATKAGLNGWNEEVLVRIKPTPPSISKYAEDVLSRAKPLKACQEKVNSLIAFFRTGMLYYKPYAKLRMTLNPFRELMKRLPPEEKRKITPFHSNYADEGDGIGAFSLTRVYDERSQPLNHLDDIIFPRIGGTFNVRHEEMSEEESGEQPTEKGQVQLRSRAIETCYGYWVADPCIDELDKSLCRASEDKRLRLESIRCWIERHRDDVIVPAYSLYLSDVRSMLDNEGVEWRRHADENLFKEGRIGKLLDSLLAALAEARVDRHCQAFVGREVPEIWEDAIAYKSFEDSFFESLACASSGRLLKEGSAGLILRSLKLSHFTAEEIRTGLRDALKDEDWYQRDFLPKRI